MISVIIPTLNSGPQLADTLSSLAASRERIEVLVVDTTPCADTDDYAGQFPWVQWLESAPGRGPQQHTGAAAATGDVLLFLHSDSTLADGWIDAVNQAVAKPDFVLGAFRLRLDHQGLAYRMIEWGVRLRGRFFQLPYGDQSLFVTREGYEAIGGFPLIPLMEDVELVWQARARGKLTLLAMPCTTSAEKWQRDGVFKRTLKNWRFYRQYKKQKRSAQELANEYE